MSLDSKAPDIYAPATSPSSSASLSSSFRGDHRHDAEQLNNAGDAGSRQILQQFVSRRIPSSELRTMDMAAESAVVLADDYEHETRPPYLHVCFSSISVKSLDFDSGHLGRYH
jgi:hypothetical protein